MAPRKRYRHANRLVAPQFTGTRIEQLLRNRHVNAINAKNPARDLSSERFGG